MAAPVSAMSSKPKFTISIHAQGTDMDSPRSIFRYNIPGKAHPVVFKRVPEITNSNIAAFHAFPARNGNGQGVALRLDFRGTGALELVTRTRGGEILLTMINGTPVDYLVIDRAVGDGIVTIWEGVPNEVVAELQKKYPPISELRSMSSGQEMLPTTKSEKKRALAEAEKRMREAGKEASQPSAETLPLPATGDNGLPTGPLKERPQIPSKKELPLIQR